MKSAMKAMELMTAASKRSPRGSGMPIARTEIATRGTETGSGMKWSPTDSTPVDALRAVAIAGSRDFPTSPESSMTIVVVIILSPELCHLAWIVLQDADGRNVVAAAPTIRPHGGGDLAAQWERQLPAMRPANIRSNNEKWRDPKRTKGCRRMYYVRRSPPCPF